jgi:hypothetical protein
MAGLTGNLRPAEGGSWSRGDTWCPRACPEPGGGRWSRRDTWRPRSCTYTLDILKRMVMEDCKPCTTPVDLQAKLGGGFSGPPVEDASQFWSIAGALQYLTFTWPDITYAVQQICLHIHDPREPHLTGMKRILRYLQGTPDYGLLLRHSSGSDLIVYTDAD